MTKKEYKAELKKLITEFGYWSQHVKDLNDFAIEFVGVVKYRKWHDEVKYQLK